RSDPRGAAARAARRDPRARARGPGLRGDRPHRAGERGGRPQAGEPWAEGLARARGRKPMSSDYISRLRGELLRAGAAQPARRRSARALRHLRPLAVAAAIAAIVAAVALTLPDGTEREVAADTVRLEYRVEPVAAALDTAV